MKKHTVLNKNWRLFSADPALLPTDIKFPRDGIAANVPGTVHQDLMNAGIIADPFFADNENKCQWIHELDWIYSCEFEPDGIITAAKNMELVLEGLDTVCDVFLNDQKILDSDNMFIKHVIPAGKYLNPGRNHLKIYFKSPLKTARDRERKYGKLPVALNSERIYLRKSQYSFGWDWGPSLPTSGIWREIYFQENSSGCIEAVRFHSVVKSESKAEADIEIELRDVNVNSSKIQIDIADNSRLIYSELLDVNSAFIRNHIQLSDIQLWWPNGLGEAKQYQLCVTLLDQNQNIIDQNIKIIGFRTILLHSKEDGEEVFRFSVNGQKVFIKGANWIPADSFLPRVAPEKYKALLEMARDANMNMIRVWGGGIYESDAFYDACDALGLMVWQDFPFACAAYPSHEEFVNSTQQEFRQNINRLQSHPSLAIWCGNNENEWLWYQESRENYESMPGSSIFHKYLPKILSELDPFRPYWPSSPFGNETDPNSEKSGNRHQWEIWSCWEDYREVIKDQGKFISEFGFQGPANVKTLNSVIPENSRQVQSKIFEHHNKQEEGNERLFRFLAAHLPVKTGWLDFNYLAQLNQGFALKTCLEHWRLRWPQTGGSIIWQLNDCWPVTSWALVDSDLLPKQSCYFVKNAFAARAVIFQMTAEKRLTVINDFKSDLDYMVDFDVVDSADGQISDTVQFLGRISAWHWENIDLSDIQLQDNQILIATLKNETDEILSRNYFSRDRWKHMSMPVSDIKLKLIKMRDDIELEIHAENAVFFLHLNSELDIRFSKQAIILLPGETQTVGISGKDISKLDESKIEIRSLNQYLAQG